MNLPATLWDELAAAASTVREQADPAAALRTIGAAMDRLVSTCLAAMRGWEGAGTPEPWPEFWPELRGQSFGRAKVPLAAAFWIEDAAWFDGEIWFDDDMPARAIAGNVNRIWVVRWTLVMLATLTMAPSGACMRFG